MPKLQDQRPGCPLEINQHEIRFSRWLPTRQRRGAFVPQPEILTKNPWEAIESALNAKMDRRSKYLDICLSFLYQAFDFYKAYETARVSSRPLLLYYALLNLAKTFVVYRNPTVGLGSAGHGLSENRGSYSQAVITASADSASRRSVYDLFSQALKNPAITHETRFRLVNDLLPQIVIGHRLWAAATNQRERFVRAEKINFLHSPSNKEIWTIIDVKRTDLHALKLNGERFTTYSALDKFTEVKPTVVANEPFDYLQTIIRLEQKIPEVYVTNPIEVIRELPDAIGKHMWCIMRTVPPYRRYYFWASRELTNRLIDPLLSVYSVIFYLGSVTRYRPYYFEDLQTSPFGNLLDEMIQTQGQQMLFHLAAEFQERDISWPAVL
jgi:hypothetical protein